MNAYQVKCYLFPANVSTTINSIKHVTEIRRFALSNVTSDYLYRELVDKIQLSFGNLLPKREEIKTYWQDEENELVGFSTSNEFQYAIDLQTAMRLSQPYNNTSGPVNSIFKVYVARKPSSEEEFEKKSSFSFEEASFEDKTHYGVSCDGCEGGVVGIRYKCKVCPDYDLCSSCKSKNIHDNHEFIEIEKPLFGRSRCPYAGKFKTGPNHHRHHHHHHQRSNGCGTGPKANENPFNAFVPLLTSNIPIVSDPQQLKNIGEYLKTFLDPFGIDVDYYVSSLNKSQASTPTTEEKKNESTPAEKKETNNQEKTEKTEQYDLLTSSKMDTSSSEVPVSSSSPTLTTPTEIILPTTSKSSLNASAPTLIDLKSSASPYDEATKALKLVVDKESKTTPNVEEKSKVNVVNTTTEDDLITEESGFNLVDIEKELKIIKAIEQLKSMGYTDDGGWLTRLASAKDGNINAVLDAISPFGTRN